MRPRRSDTTSTFAPAARRARSGTVSSTFSNPSAARTAIRRPLRVFLLDMSTSCAGSLPVPTPGRPTPLLLTPGLPATTSRSERNPCQGTQWAVSERTLHWASALVSRRASGVAGRWWVQAAVVGRRSIDPRDVEGAVVVAEVEVAVGAAPQVGAGREERVGPAAVGLE